MDGTGIKVEGEEERNARRHGGPERRVWRKIHLGIDEHTLEVRVVEVTGRNSGDAPMLPELLNQIPGDRAICSVTADEAYDTRNCHNASAARGAHAVIAPRKKRPALETCSRWCGRRKRDFARIEMPGPRALTELERLPPPKPRRDEPARDHVLHNAAGQGMHCVKLLGQRFMARDFDRQIAEIQVRIAVPTGHTAPGTPITETTG